MMKSHPRRFSKSLLFLAVFCAAIQGGAAPAQTDESPAVAVPVPDPQGETPTVYLDPIPPTMSAEEFNEHMKGAGEAGLTLEGFLALRAQEPGLTVLDVRAPQGFAYQRIEGSVNLPVTEMTEHTLPVLLTDRAAPVVLVCDESFAPTRRISMTLQAWPVLKANGYTRVYRLNLWRPETEGGRMLAPGEIEKRLPLEGTFKPAPVQEQQAP